MDGADLEEKVGENFQYGDDPEDREEKKDANWW